MTSPSPAIKLVYRSYGGENFKDRPSYYSKLLTLASFVRAAREVPDAEVVFVNDGPIPPVRHDLMVRSGSVHQLAPDPLGMRTSYWKSLNLPDTYGWKDSDVVFYVEDDYLFVDDAFVVLQKGVERLPQASYFGLYGEVRDYDDREQRRQYGVPRGWVTQPDVNVDGDVWFHLSSTASTFGARVGALRSDLDIFRMCLRPFRRRYLDHETCVMYQGLVPYHGTELVMGTPGDFAPTLRGVARTLFLIPFRFALNRRARRQQPHYLFAVTPNRATHLENAVMTADQDWEGVAREIVDWAEREGLSDVVKELRALSSAR